MILDEGLVYKRRKITEVFYRKKVNRRKRNDYGEWEIVEEDAIFRRPVETVSGWIRFANFLIDYYLVMFLVSFLSLFVRIVAPSILVAYMPLIVLVLHFIVGEFYIQKTLGKFITRTVVVNEYGEPPEFKSVLLRTVIRFIPFEPFSFLGEEGRGWHDRWTNTYVLRRSELETIRELLRNQEENPVEAQPF